VLKKLTIDQPLLSNGIGFTPTTPATYSSLDGDQLFSNAISRAFLIFVDLM
jgi:hypothetical protein